MSTIDLSDLDVPDQRTQPQDYPHELDRYRSGGGVIGRSLAQQILGAPGGPATLGDRATRARCLRATEAYEPAWGELCSLRAATPTGPLRARVTVELLILSYYLAREIDEEGSASLVETEAGGTPEILAELRLALSMRATARNDLRLAAQQIHFAADSTLAVKDDRDRWLLTARIQRHAGHVFVQGGNYRDALAAIERARVSARRLEDPWELAWTTYAQGFVESCRGAPVTASRYYERSLSELAGIDSSLPRWVNYCLARTYLDQGRVGEAQEILATTSYRLPEDLAYFALCHGDLTAAEGILEPHLGTGDPFVHAVAGIVAGLGGRRSALEFLDRARTAFIIGGLDHYRLAVEVHIGFVSSLFRRGAGIAMARNAVQELSRRGAIGVHWPHMPLTTWMAETRIGPSLDFGREYAPTLSTDSADLVFLSRIGLTHREAEIVMRIVADERTTPCSRKQLACDLGISASTLRVHMNRIRAKLAVGRRGDNALLESVELLLSSNRQPNTSARQRVIRV